MRIGNAEFQKLCRIQILYYTDISLLHLYFQIGVLTTFFNREVPN